MVTGFASLVNLIIRHTQGSTMCGERDMGHIHGVVSSYMGVGELICSMESHKFNSTLEETVFSPLRAAKRWQAALNIGFNTCGSTTVT